MLGGVTVADPQAPGTAQPGAPTAPQTMEYAPAEPVDLRLLLGPLRRGRGDPTLQVDPGGAWRTTLATTGPATVRLEARGGGVRAWAWGPGADETLAGVPELLGAGDDWSELDCSGHPLLAEIRRGRPGLRLTRTGAVWEALVPAVLEQKITGKEARASWRWLLGRYGLPAPGPAPLGMRVCPPASVWARIPSWDWHRAGVDPKRSRTVLAAAGVAYVLERSLGLGRGGAPVAALLRSVPGVGAWTAAEVSQRAHGDPDAVSVGDYHLAAFVGWALTGRPVDDDGMLDLLAPYAGSRYRVIRLVEVSGARKPRFGPRLTVADHRRH